MTLPVEPTPDAHTDYRNEGIRSLLDTFAVGDPGEHLSLRAILADLQQGAFGVFLFIAILPAFVPIPGVGGAVSGPLVIMIGVQMVLGLRRPWLPGFIGRRGPYRRTMQRFLHRISPPLRRLDRMLKPRLAALFEPLPAHMLTGALLVATGLLLSLPIPFTNYLFGFQLLLFALALLERDGALMLFNWIGAIAAIVFFGISSGHLIGFMTEQYQRWFG